MASSIPPVKNAAFTFDVALVSQADTDIFKTSPTLAAGDILVSKDGGNFANIGTLPTQIQTTGVLPVALTADEMNADIVTVLFHDASGSEWQDAVVTIYTAGQTLDAIEGLVDDLESRVGTPSDLGSGATVAANLVDIEGQTDDIGVAGAGLTALGDTRLANLDAAVSTRSSHSAADVWSVGTRTLTSFGTLVADIWSYTTRTLTSLSALVSSIATSVWSYATRTLTQTAAQVAAVMSGSTITVTRGDTTTFSLTGLGDITGYKEVWFTVKENPSSEADSSSVLMIKESAGLAYLNGATVATPYASTDADLTVDDDATGDITITIEALATGALSPRGGLSYDVQWKDGSDAIHTLTMGTFNVSTDVTRATS